MPPARPINRITPQLPVQAMQTYRIDAPLATHWIAATCAEVDCPHHERGWRSLIDESTDLGQQQAHYIRALSGRSFHEERDELGMTVFTFAPGQPCFRTHQRRVDRPELFSVVGGDWRATLSSPRVMRPVDWVEHMQEGLESLQQRAERG